MRREDREKIDAMRRLYENNVLLRDDAKAILPRREFPSLHKCGDPIEDNGLVSFVVSDGGMAHEAEKVCGSPWICPVCAPRKQGVWARDIEAMIHTALSSGFHIYLMTMTIPHGKGDSLDLLMSYLTDINGRVMSSRPVSRMNEKAGYLGSVRSFDIVYSRESGWHPHFHNLLFYKSGMPVKEISEIVFERYRNQMGKQAGRRASRRAFDVEEVYGGTDLARYVSKMELARYINKGGKASSASLYPFDFLGTEDKGKEALFLEYAIATKDKSKTRTTKGLRKRLGEECGYITPEKKEPSKIHPPVDVCALMNMGRGGVLKMEYCRLIEDPSDLDAFLSIRERILEVSWPYEAKASFLRHIEEVREDAVGEADGDILVEFEELDE